MTEMVRSLLKGPTRWLDPVVTSSFPSDTELKKGVTSLSPDDRNRVKSGVRSTEGRPGRRNPECNKMATQLLFTLQDLTPTGVDEVELQRSNGSQLCVVTESRAETVASHGTAKHPEYQYFIDAKQRLVRLPSGNRDKQPEPVPGALGVGDKSCGRPRCPGPRTARPVCWRTGVRCTSDRWCRVPRWGTRCCTARGRRRTTG